MKYIFHVLVLLTRHYSVPLIDSLFGKELVGVFGNICFVGIPLGDFSADYMIVQTVSPRSQSMVKMMMPQK